MIKGFRHRGLKELFRKGSSRRVSPDLQRKALRILDALEASTRPEDMNVPGFDFHSLKGNPKRWSCHVNGNWCITFEWDDDPIRVNLEDYH
ncbi:MAG: type II toxin-antitoxin system RelE/ParE family toxin [Rhodospirillaceae bacterium]|jgi:toxin HigB-1|nr:type II toxin-antitoxin system RelE/ParE family toxin [Rhodospirillaceae bacterium]